MRGCLTAAQNARYRKQAAKKRAKRREEGKCPGCGGERDDGFNYCSTCRGRRDTPEARRRRKKLRAVFIKNGRCVDCFGAREAMPGTVRCAVCAERADEWIARARVKAVKEGKCPLCLKRPVTAGTTSTGRPWKSCLSCRERAKQAKARLGQAQKAGQVLASTRKAPSRNKAA